MDQSSLSGLSFHSFSTFVFNTSFIKATYSVNPGPQVSAPLPSLGPDTEEEALLSTGSQQSEPTRTAMASLQGEMAPGSLPP